MRYTATAVKVIALSMILTTVCFALGACGNTVKGIGTDIVKMGENIMKEEPKNDSK